MALMTMVTRAARVTMVEFVKYIVLHWKYYIVASLEKGYLFNSFWRFFCFQAFRFFFNLRLSLLLLAFWPSQWTASSGRRSSLGASCRRSRRHRAHITRTNSAISGNNRPKSRKRPLQPAAVDNTMASKLFLFLFVRSLRSQITY